MNAENTEKPKKQTRIKPKHRSNLPETTRERYQLPKGDPTTRANIKRKFQHVAKDLVVDATLNPHVKKKKRNSKFFATRIFFIRARR